MVRFWPRAWGLSGLIPNSTVCVCVCVLYLYELAQEITSKQFKVPALIKLMYLNLPITVCVMCVCMTPSTPHPIHTLTITVHNTTDESSVDSFAITFLFY